MQHYTFLEAVAYGAMIPGFMLVSVYLDNLFYNIRRRKGAK